MPKKFKAVIAFPETMSQTKPKAGAKVPRRKATHSAKSNVNKNLNSLFSLSSQSGLPTAFSTSGRIPRVPGMSNLNEMTFSYSCGQMATWINASGASLTNYGYSALVDTSFGYINVNGIPISPADNNFGQNYVGDVMKHYMRRKIHRVWVVMEPLISSTGTPSVTITGGTASFAPGLHLIAPIRGGGFNPNFNTYSAAGWVATSLPDIATMESIQGAVPFTTWEHAVLDLTPYIAGGTGPQSNEFNTKLNSPLVAASSATPDVTLACPCGFVVGGLLPLASNTSTTASYTLFTHRIRVIITVSLLDYIGNLSFYLGSNNTPGLETSDKIKHSVTPPNTPRDGEIRMESSDRSDPSNRTWKLSKEELDPDPPVLVKADLIRKDYISQKYKALTIQS